MARMARIKMDGEAAAYHLYGRMAGVKGEYPLTKPLYRKRPSASTRGPLLCQRHDKVPAPAGHLFRFDYSRKGRFGN